LRIAKSTLAVVWFVLGGVKRGGGCVPL
jgi:hypothetical protein